MGLFKRKKDEEAKIQLEREALDKLNGNGVGFFEIPDDSATNNTSSDWQINGKMKAPHTITAEELNASARKSNDVSAQDYISEEIPMSETKEEAEESPSNFLYQKMMQSRIKLSENTIESENPTDSIEEKTIDENTSIPSEAPSAPLDIAAAIDELKNLANPNKDSSGELVENPSIEGTEKTDEPVISREDDMANMGSNAEERRVTLLARCNAFLEDDSGPIKTNVEKYKLESVESILKGFEARAAERANKKFNTDHSVFSTSFESDIKSPSKEDVKSPSYSANDTIVFEKAATEAPVKTEPENDTNDNLQNDDSKKVKHIFTADVTPKKHLEFEDISSTKIINNIGTKAEKPISAPPTERTSVFPVVEPIIDTSGSKENIVEDKNSAQGDEEGIQIDDYTGIADRSKILCSLLRNKKAFVIKSVLSLFALIIAVIITVSPIANKLAPTTVAIADLSLCLFLSAINFNVFSGISSLFGKKVKTCLPAALALLSANSFSVLNLIFKENLVGFSAVAALSLVSYNYANKRFYSKTIKNFRLIADETPKKAISIIQNKNATRKIVDKAINGSALVCYGGEATNIHNFLKYTYCKNPISDKIQKLSIVGIIVGAILALAFGILNSANFISAFYIFAASICFTSIPSAFHIVSLTVNSANKRLNHYDAMITGYRAADELELCNGIAIDSSSLFPDGTIRLVDMKLLSPNPFDQSMLDAAAIAANIHSPLAGIFKQMDTSKINDIPEQEVDSVIYEEKMGISGWVSDRRVFIGNRDLLIAHGFSGLPPAELDKKIMRKGYFPVYIASDNILCALLIVKYEPDENIIYEIQRLANTGTTIMVDNCDPNINEKMLADYFKVYDETIFVMSKQGSDYYKALISHKEHRKAGAAYRSRIEGLLATLTASINIKKYISRMSAFYIVSVVIGLLAISACIFTSLAKLITPLNILVIHLIITAIMLLPAVFRKP